MNAELSAIITHWQYHMSAQDIADEFGYNRADVAYHARTLGIKLPSPKQVMLMYLKRMDGKKTIEQLVKITGYGSANLKLLMKELDSVVLPAAVEEIEVQESKRIAFNKLWMASELKDRIKGVNQGERNKPRIKEPYQQGSSPFGLADELRGITLK